MADPRPNVIRQSGRYSKNGTSNRKIWQKKSNVYANDVANELVCSNFAGFVQNKMQLNRISFPVLSLVTSVLTIIPPVSNFKYYQLFSLKDFCGDGVEDRRTQHDLSSERLCSSGSISLPLMLPAGWTFFLGLGQLHNITKLRNWKGRKNILFKQHYHYSLCVKENPTLARAMLQELQPTAAKTWRLERPWSKRFYLIFVVVVGCCGSLG